MRSYEEQIRIEHIKLSIAYAVFTILETIFFFLTLCVLPLIAILASWAGENFNMKLIGISISFLYFFLTCGLAILFQNMAFNNRDDFMIAGHTKDFDVIWKYKSEILAERKMKERGLFYPDGAGNFEGKRGLGMKWNASVDMTVTIDYEDIEAESEKEAKQIAEDMAREDIDYNNCNAEESSVHAFLWERED